METSIQRGLLNHRPQCFHIKQQHLLSTHPDMIDLRYGLVMIVGFYAINRSSHTFNTLRTDPRWRPEAPHVTDQHHTLSSVTSSHISLNLCMAPEELPGARTSLSFIHSCFLISDTRTKHAHRSHTSSSPVETRFSYG